MKRLSLFFFTLILSSTALLSQITIVKGGANGGNIGLGTLTPQEDIHLVADKILWQDNDGKDYLRSYVLNNGNVISVGGQGNGRLRVRHISGKHFSSDYYSSLYLQYYADHKVIIGNPNQFNMSNRANNSLIVYGDIKTQGDFYRQGTVLSTSDKNLKNNILPLSYGLNEVLSLSPIHFQYNGKMGTRTGSKHIGILAQDLKKVAPELVVEQEYIEHDAEHPKPLKKGTYLAIKDNEVKWLLVNAIKEQQSIIDTQKEDIDQLKDEISELRSLIKDFVSTSNNSKDVHLQGEAFLGQNEPNPFNATTRIAYKLPGGISSGKIAFYGLDGSMLHTVQINDAQGNINLSQDDLPNGQYTYSLIVNGQIWDTKKMILQK